MRRRAWGVLAAYLIVVQAALAGLALGTQPVAADPFSVLCSSAAPTDAPAPAKPHGGLPDCCVAGCPMLGGGMLPPDVLPAAGPTPSEIVDLTQGRSGLGRSLPERSPRSTRGPPATA